MPSNFASSISLKFAIALFIGTIILPHIAQAQKFLHDKKVPVAVHEKRSSRFKLKGSGEKVDLRAWGSLFEAKRDIRKKLYAGKVISYLELPECRDSKVELTKVFNVSAISRGIDVVYYSAASRSQRKAARKFKGKTVAYSPALLKLAKTGQPDFWQKLARFVRIKCLPTRFHFVTVGNQRYKSRRSGARAWD